MLIKQIRTHASLFLLFIVFTFALGANAQLCNDRLTIGQDPTQLIVEKPETVRNILSRKTLLTGLHFKVPEFSPVMLQMIRELDNVPARLAKVEGHAVSKALLSARMRGLRGQIELALPSLTYHQSIVFSFKYAWFFTRLLYLEMGDKLLDNSRFDSKDFNFSSADVDYFLDLNETLKILSHGAILLVPATRVISIPEINRLYDNSACTLGALAYPTPRRLGPFAFLRHDVSHLRTKFNAMTSFKTNLESLKENSKLSAKAAELIYPQLDARAMDETWVYNGRLVSRELIENAIFTIGHEGNWISANWIKHSGSFAKLKEKHLVSLVYGKFNHRPDANDPDDPPTTETAIKWVLDHWEKAYEQLNK